MAGDNFLNAAGIEKHGNDTIFSWWAKFQEAKAAGKPAVNGTIGALLEDNGNLAINKVVDAALEKHQSRKLRLMHHLRVSFIPRFDQNIGIW